MKPDDSDNSLAGTGDKIASFAGGRLELYDDGDDDPYVMWVARLHDGTDYRYRDLQDMRAFLGDTLLAELLSNDSQSDTQSGNTGGVFDRGPPAFKCKGCNLTWPRSKNDGTDHCPKCGDGDD